MKQGILEWKSLCAWGLVLGIERADCVCRDMQSFELITVHGTWRSPFFFFFSGCRVEDHDERTDD